MIVVGGDNLIDLIQTGAVTDRVQFAGKRGGSAYNTAMALGRLDAETAFISPMSTDNLGRLLRQGLEESGVGVIGPKLDAPTSLAVVTFDGEQPSYRFYRENTAERLVSAKELRESWPEGAVVFHLASLAITDGQDADLWAEFYCEIHGRGITTTLDPNIRPMVIADRESYLERLKRLLEHTNILKLSDEDIAWMYPESDIEAAFDELVSATAANLCILTLGAHGAIGRLGNISSKIGAVEVSQFQDSVGAGDTFMAAVIAESLRLDLLNSQSGPRQTYENLESVLRTAASAAAINCTREGCDPPTRSELDQ